MPRPPCPSHQIPSKPTTSTIPTTPALLNPYKISQNRPAGYHSYHQINHPRLRQPPVHPCEPVDPIPNPQHNQINQRREQDVIRPYRPGDIKMEQAEHCPLTAAAGAAVAGQQMDRAAQKHPGCLPRLEIYDYQRRNGHKSHGGAESMIFLSVDHQKQLMETEERHLERNPQKPQHNSGDNPPLGAFGATLGFGKIAPIVGRFHFR